MDGSTEQKFVTPHLWKMNSSAVMHQGVPASVVHLPVVFSSSVRQSITETGFAQSMQSGLV